MSREGAVDDEAHFSPSRIKFPCSYGGKILPRPSDGQLKYVGGETRIISVPRSITFQELKEKISGLFNNSDIVIKYQIYPEDLDTLVSVRSDEDLQYMLEEYGRHESIPRSPSSSPRFRIFVFPSTKIPSSTPSPTHRSSLTRATIPIPKGTTPHSQFGFNSPSPGTSPPNSSFISNPRPLGLHRVRSTPNLSQMGGANSSNGSSSNNNNVGSPGVGSGLSSNGTPLHVNPLNPQYRNVGQHGGNGRGDMSRVGVSYRYETCVCGRVIMGHQRRGRRYQYPQFGGPKCPHQSPHTEDCHGPHMNGPHLSGSSPRFRQMNMWD